MINTITDQVKKVFGDVYITTLVPTEIKQELHLFIIFFLFYLLPTDHHNIILPKNTIAH